jgi:hypothetical protein
LRRGGLLRVEGEGRAVGEENKDASVIINTYQALDILILISKLHKIVLMKQFIQ